VLSTIAANAAIAASAFAAHTSTGASAALATAIHAIVAASSAGLVLHGLERAAAAPSDHDRPRELGFWGFVVAPLLYAMGAGVAIFDGVGRLLAPRALDEPAVAIGAQAIALLLAAFVALRARSALLDATRHEPALIATAIQGRIAMFGAAGALAGVIAADLVPFPAADGAATLWIGLVMVAGAAMLALEAKALVTADDHRAEAPEWAGPSLADDSGDDLDGDAEGRDDGRLPVGDGGAHPRPMNRKERRRARHQH
jgi:divalent metal cation (Fe/Co/Zn/Cd) transporter